MTVTQVGRATLTEDVHLRLYRSLIDGELAPGSKLKLAELATRFEVSPSVLREVLTRLAERGLVQANPRRGFSVRSLTVEDLADLTRTRLLIEPLALRQSIETADVSWEAQVLASHHMLERTPLADGHVNPAWADAHRAFHHILLGGCGSRRLSEFARSLRDCSELYQFFSYKVARDPSRDIAAEHREIAERSVARDAEAATAALSRHIERTTAGLARLLTERSGD